MDFSHFHLRRTEHLYSGNQRSNRLLWRKVSGAGMGLARVRQIYSRRFIGFEYLHNLSLSQLGYRHRTLNRGVCFLLPLCAILY